MLKMPPLTLDQLLDAERRLDYELRLAQAQDDLTSALLARAGLENIRRKIADIVDTELDQLDLTATGASSGYSGA